MSRKRAMPNSGRKAAGPVHGIAETAIHERGVVLKRCTRPDPAGFLLNSLPLVEHTNQAGLAAGLSNRRARRQGEWQVPLVSFDTFRLAEICIKRGRCTQAVHLPRSSRLPPELLALLLNTRTRPAWSQVFRTGGQGGKENGRLLWFHLIHSGLPGSA